jgi:hypothetical protein
LPGIIRLDAACLLAGRYLEQHNPAPQGPQGNPHNPPGPGREIVAILSRLDSKLGVFTEEKSGIPRLFRLSNPGNFAGE